MFSWLCFGKFVAIHVCRGFLPGMQAEDTPSFATPTPLDGAKGGHRMVKKFKHMKRSLAETTAVAPKFGDVEMSTNDITDWSTDNLKVESDNEEEDLNDDIPVVKLPKALRSKLNLGETLCKFKLHK